MKKAWTENGKLRDVCHGNPYDLYHPDVAKLYTADVPDDAANGDGWDGTTLTKPEVVIPAPQEPVVVYPKLSPLQFKMCFTSQERTAIKALRATNPVIEDAYEILDDPRLTTVDLSLASNQGLIDYLVSLSVLTAERAAQIKLGVML